MAPTHPAPTQISFSARARDTLHCLSTTSAMATLGDIMIHQTIMSIELGRTTRPDTDLSYSYPRTGPLTCTIHIIGRVRHLTLSLHVVIQIHFHSITFNNHFQ